MKKSFLLLALAALLAAPAWAQDDFNARKQAVLSRLQKMGHGYYSDEEWKSVLTDVSSLVSEARSSGDGDALVQAKVIEASVVGDMRRDYPSAIALLRQARAEIAGQPSVDASRLYVKEAELLAASGNQPAVDSLIAEYKNSPYYRPEMYAWAGGNGPDDPLLIARPRAEGGASLPLSIMEMASRRATSAVGTAFPDASLTDVFNRDFALSAYRGRVVLVDFFARGWKLWDEFLPQQLEIWRRYHDAGFEIVGVSLESNPAGLETLNLPWPIAVGPSAQALARQLGIFGASTSYLLDASGKVIARNLRGQDLSFAVRTALESK